VYYIYSFEDYERMIRHWIGTVPNSYIGQSYGFNLHKTLLKPMSIDEADQILREMKEQIPPLQLLKPDQLMVSRGPEVTATEKYYITLNGNIHIELFDVDNSMYAAQGDSFYANSQ